MSNKSKQNSYHKNHPVACKYLSILSKRKKKGIDVSKAPSIEEVEAKLGQYTPESSDLFEYAISFSPNGENSLISKEYCDLLIENCHWARRIKTAKLREIVERSTTLPSRRYCIDYICKKLKAHAACEELTEDEIFAIVSEARWKADPSHFIGKTFGTIVCEGAISRGNSYKGLCRCTRCGHKFKRFLKEIYQKKYFCPRCQGMAEFQKRCSRNSATVTFWQSRYISEAYQLD